MRSASSSKKSVCPTADLMPTGSPVASAMRSIKSIRLGTSWNDQTSGTAPSNLFISGRYILQPEIFALLGAHQTGAGGEIQLTDAMIRLAKTQAFYGYQFRGKSFDCGSKIGFLHANVAFALAHEDLATEFRQVLRDLLAEDLG